MVPQLAYLRAVQALVDLPVRVGAFLLGPLMWWPLVLSLATQAAYPAACSPQLCCASPRFLTCCLKYLRPTFAALQKAAAIDPHNVAAQPGPEGEAAAQVRTLGCLLVASRCRCFPVVV